MFRLLFLYIILYIIYLLFVDYFYFYNNTFPILHQQQLYNIICVFALNAFYMYDFLFVRIENLKENIIILCWAELN